ncbi:retrotransposon protein, putative, Ty1-copia subclass [Panicum miliaceum]|uniref:Retrotransposon protein, putative, Ty1-copia subclass n=1 Tax=Panicum miliaceum TaxID=4540 RepID=A0A3L6RW80_PANMI|nr:retrotransposon protein, putative, Ty1-copia subclass [Panicum miliaceum]
MGRSGGEPSGQRRQKRLHDPHVQREEESPPSPVPGARPHRRPGKEPATSGDPSRKAPYIMRSMPVPPPSRANPSRRVEVAPDQQQYPRCPMLARPQIVPGFAVELGRDYFGQKVALRNARNEEVYRFDKCEGFERRFWCQLHQDFYASVVLHKGKVPIVPCRYVDWAYFERLDDPFFNEAIAKCKEFGLYDIMGFRYNWNEEILAQFHSSMYYDARKIAFVWTTEGPKYEVDCMTFSRLLALGSKDEERTCIHIENQLKPNQMPSLFFNPLLAQKENGSTLQPFYYTMNQFFRATIDGKDGDPTALRYYAFNLLTRTMPGGRPFCIMDFIWNELRRAMCDLTKFLPAAPYIIYD